MTFYYLIQRQDGEGCDYTIGCGIRISQIQASNIEEAKENANEMIGNYWKYKYDYSIDRATLLVVSEEIDLASFLDQKKTEREAEITKEKQDKIEAEELAQFERLRRKYGK